MTEEYFYKNKSSSDGFNPYCKEATKIRARKRQLENHDEYKEYVRNHHKYNRKHNKKMIEYDRKHAKEQKESGYTKEYYEKNKSYFSNYQKERMMNKTHEITEEEWLRCKKYFNNSCAYCGLSEEEHYIIYAGKPKKTDLHREHVDHNGSNKIDNCIPACQMCNCSKWAFTLEDWYNEENPNFSQERLDKIYKWLQGDYKLIK
jgi:G3E family GTPase